MRLKGLELDFFRNYLHFEGSFSPGVNVIWGENAQGKTNLLEAAAYLSTASSHRARYDKELIQFGVDHAFLQGEVEARGRTFALEALNIDKFGLDEIDNKILTTIIDKFKGGPVGINTIATAIGEDGGTVEEVYEPFLIKEGFIKRTPRGREVTELAYKHLGRLRTPDGMQRSLFD